MRVDMFRTRVCVCYYEAIRDPLPSAFTLIGAVRLHSHVHQHKQPRSALRVFLIARASALATQQALLAAPAHWHATCQLASAASGMVSSSAAYTCGHRHMHVGVGGRAT